MSSPGSSHKTSRSQRSVECGDGGYIIRNGVADHHVAFGPTCPQIPTSSQDPISSSTMNTGADNAADKQTKEPVE
ncbi:hypothetical protein FRC03_008082 [Tulasnella sp. 419]|nr:hypothetical protein FRC03_008082 [Tulasnella sp. 419]